MRTSVVCFSCILATVAMTFASAAFTDEPYQYIKTPGYDPAIYSASNSSAVASSSTSLTTGTQSLPAAEPSSLEARFRTWLESIGTALKSTKFRSIVISFF